MWPAASSPARPSCCMAITPIWAGPTRSTTPTSPPSTGWSSIPPARTSTGSTANGSDFEKGDAAIRVKIWGPLIWTVHRPLLWSVQGPGVRRPTAGPSPSLRRQGEARQPLQYYRLEQGRQPRAMAGRHAAAGAPQHQLHLRRRDGKHRLRLQRPVPRPRRGARLDGHPARRPIRPDLARLSAVRARAADLESRSRAMCSTPTTRRSRRPVPRTP